MTHLDAAVGALSRVMAFLGGAVLIILTVVTVVSIVGRGFVFAGLGPVPGDFELVEAGTAFAVFAFLPWCTFNRGHAMVNVFTTRLSPRARGALDLIADILLAIAAVVLAWRLWLGTLDKQSYGETTFILQFPLWWAFAASLAGAAVFVIVSVYMVARRIAELAHGPQVSDAEGP